MSTSLARVLHIPKIRSRSPQAQAHTVDFASGLSDPDRVAFTTTMFTAIRMNLECQQALQRFIRVGQTLFVENASGDDFTIDEDAIRHCQAAIGLVPFTFNRTMFTVSDVIRDIGYAALAEMKRTNNLGTFLVTLGLSFHSFSFSSFPH